MAIINRGILGGFRGKIGNVIGSSWKGIDTMRAMPISVANPRTNSQVENRSRFALLSKLLSSMLTTIVKPLNDRWAQKMSGYNAVSQRSKDAFDSAGAFIPGNLILSRGKLGGTSEFTAVDDGVGEIRVKWDDTINGDYQKHTDVAYVSIIDVNGKLVHAEGGIVQRQAGQVYMQLDITPDEPYPFYVYLSFVSADGTLVGNSSMSVLTNA